MPRRRSVTRIARGFWNAEATSGRAGLELRRGPIDGSEAASASISGTTTGSAHIDERRGLPAQGERLVLGGDDDGDGVALVEHAARELGGDLVGEHRVEDLVGVVVGDRRTSDHVPPGR